MPWKNTEEFSSKLTYELNLEGHWEEVYDVEEDSPCSTNQ